MPIHRYALVVAATLALLAAAPVEAGDRSGSQARDGKGGVAASRDARGDRRDRGATQRGRRDAAAPAGEVARDRRSAHRTSERLRDRVGDLQERQIRQERRQARALAQDGAERLRDLQDRQRPLERRERQLVDRIGRLADRYDRDRLSAKVERFDRLQRIENRLERRERSLAARLGTLVDRDDAPGRAIDRVTGRLRGLQQQEIAIHRREARLLDGPPGGSAPGPGRPPGPGPAPGPGPDPGGDGSGGDDGGDDGGVAGPGPAPGPGGGGDDPGPGAPAPDRTAPGGFAPAGGDGTGSSSTLGDQRTFCRGSGGTPTHPVCAAPRVTLAPYR